MTKENYTLITGASTGIGKAFALECAPRGMNLLLVSLPENVLEETKEEIKTNYSDAVAKIGVEGMMRGKGVIVPGKINWSLVKLMKLFPTQIKMKILERLFRVYLDH